MKIMKNNKKFCIFLGIFLVFLQLFCVFYLTFNNNIVRNSSAIYEKSNKINENNITSKGMITIESSSGRILYKKDENKRLPMASTTKILTAIVAIENCKNLDEKHKIPANSVGIEGSSIYLRENEHLSIRELLYGLMLRSGNDSAVAIATIISGSVENFVNLMNDFCKKLNLKNTNIELISHGDGNYRLYGIDFDSCFIYTATVGSDELNKIEYKYISN